MAKPKSLKPPAKRIAIQQAIDLRFPTFEGLVTKISSNLSTTGMFVQTGSPADVGTEFSFRIHIEEWSPIRGDARVIWTRSEPEGSKRPAGMGVEFTQLDAQSRRMIRWLVDKHRDEGGTPFDLGSIPVGATKTARSRARALSKGSKSNTSSLPMVVIWILILAAVGFGGYYWWQIQQGPASTESRRQPPPQSVSEKPAIEASPDSAADSATSASSDPEPVSDSTGASQLIDDWAAAWEDQRADDLLALYSKRFEPSGDLTRAEWEAQIRDRVEKSDFILVAISGLNLGFSSANAARATFYRSIRSDSENNTGRIQLDLEASDDTWLILKETDLD